MRAFFRTFGGTGGFLNVEKRAPNFSKNSNFFWKMRPPKGSAPTPTGETPSWPPGKMMPNQTPAGKAPGTWFSRIKTAQKGFRTDFQAPEFHAGPPKKPSEFHFEFPKTPSKLHSEFHSEFPKIASQIPIRINLRIYHRINLRINFRINSRIKFRISTSHGRSGSR